MKITIDFDVFFEDEINILDAEILDKAIREQLAGHNETIKGNFIVKKVYDFAGTILLNHMPRMIRTGRKYSPEEILPLIEEYPEENNLYKELKKYKVKLFSKRMKTFKNSITCACCGLNGEFFIIEKERIEGIERFHLNLYGLRDKVEVLMTSDHIIPQSKNKSIAGLMSNRQTLCCKCNQLKDNRIISIEDLRKEIR